jgi:hypothetical protein
LLGSIDKVFEFHIQDFEVVCFDSMSFIKIFQLF